MATTTSCSTTITSTTTTTQCCTTTIPNHSLQKIHNCIPIEKPIKVTGKVIKGFGRGGKLLGIPTANLPIENCKELPKIEMGVYIGYAKIRNIICKTVISIGNNPHFENEMKTIEPHLLYDFNGEDFYDEVLTITICGFIRLMEKYNNLNDLIHAIKNDILIGSQALDCEPYLKAKEELLLVLDE